MSAGALRRIAFSLLTVLVTASAVSGQSARPAAPGPALKPVPTTREAPNDFGTGYVVTVIPAASFTSDDHYVTDYGSLFRYFPFSGSHRLYYAGLSEIPAGAVIDYVGLECASTGTGELTVTPFYADESSGATSGIVALQNTPHSYGLDYNAQPLGWRLVRNVHNMITIVVDQAPNTEPLFGWVEIWWKRTVSDPPASPSFTDVPATDFGYQYIEALKASGITGGCGGTLFCPDQYVTRRQMAIFLAKALGLHWAY